MAKNYSEMTVKELKEMAKNNGIKGYSKLNKSDLISVLNAEENKKNSIKKEAYNEAKKELGTNYNKAVAFWSSLNNNKKAHWYNMKEVVLVWNILSHIANEEEAFTSLEMMARSIANIFGVKDFNANNKSDEEFSAFINEYIEQFKRDTQTETLHKEGYKIIKASLSDVEIIDNVCYFNSANASVFTQDEIKIMRQENGGKIYSMRVVETSENGISRVLDTLGNDMTYLMLYMGDVDSENSWNGLAINTLKEMIFMNGIVDRATGTHYNFGIKGPSMDRKANHLFIPVEGWKETFDLWFKITGTKDINGFVSAFGDDVVMAKMLARVSTRGSSSFDTSKVSPEVAEEIKKFNVYYAKDTETIVQRDYHQLVAPNTLEARSGDREITDADGQGLISVTANAKVAKAMRTITNNEYAELIKLWNEHCKTGNLASVIPQSRLGILISKMPHVWQIRHGEKKGLLVMADLENIKETESYDVICPDSVRKFVGGEWSEYPLEICNFLKKKKNLVYLNPQFIEALDFENPNALIPIIDDLLQFMNDSMTDIQKRMEFHKTFVSDNDTTTTIGSFLVDAITTNTDLMNEPQVQKWSLAQYEKMIMDLKVGRIPVPGMYSYMVFDPYYQINKIFGTNLPTLKSGEFYHNGLYCKCGLFRSPLIHPFEAQKVQLVNKTQYWYLTDCAVFNGFDGTADRMGGGDFDGDICAIIPDNTWQGKIVVDGIRELDYDVWEPAQKAKKAYFVPDANNDKAMANLIKHLVDGAKVDRTGIITNYASRALDIANHLKSAIHFAKRANCDDITFIHPELFGKDKAYGATYVPHKEGNTFCLKGICKGMYVEEPQGSGNFKLIWDVDSSEAIIGKKTFEEVEEYIGKYLRLVEILRVLQGREIDGAKTGVFAEGISGKDFTDNVKIINSPSTMLTRQISLGRRSEENRLDKATINSFVTLSPWGRVHDYIDMKLYNLDGTPKSNTFLDILTNRGIDKCYILNSLLTEEEKKAINNKYLMSDGSSMTLVEMMVARKSVYNNNIRNISIASNEIKSEVTKNSGNDLEAEDILGTFSIGTIKEKEYAELANIASIINVPMTAVAAACYLGTYMSKDGATNTGISYAWIIPDALLEIFSRQNKKWGWFRVPNNAETVSVKNNTLYVNDKVFSSINAYDTDFALIKIINDNKYAWIQRRVDMVVEPSATVSNTIVNGKTYTVKALGMNYYASFNVDGWKAMVKANKFCFDVKISEEGRLEAFINGTPICTLKGDRDIELSTMELIGKTVKIVNNPNSNPIKFNANSISNISVMIIA